MKKEFLWSAGISTNQHEGAYVEDGKGLSIADCMSTSNTSALRKVTYMDKEGNIHDEDFNRVNVSSVVFFGKYEKYRYPSETGSDFYHRYKEDIRLAYEMGANSFRMTIAWSRIYPNGYDDRPNIKGLLFYDHVLDELEKYHLEPVVMLSHYEIPIGLVNRLGAWEDKRTIDCYVRYVKTTYATASEIQ